MKIFKSKEDKLFKAIEEGNLAKVIRLLHRGEMKILKSKEDKLFKAVEEGNLAEVIRLLQKGANVNAREKSPYTSGNTPLHLAAEKGYEDIAELLIDKGADVMALDLYRHTPLHLAALFGHAEVAELLIAKGADLNARETETGSTPLHEAVFGRHKNVVELLIAKGADLNVEKKTTNDTPLDTAERGQEYMAELLKIAELLKEHGAKGRHDDEI